MKETTTIQACVLAAFLMFAGGCALGSTLETGDPGPTGEPDSFLSALLADDDDDDDDD